MNTSYDRGNLIDDLKDLMAELVSDKEQLKEWNRRANLVEEKIYNSNLHSVIPEYVIHYLNDADIRLKDPEYGRSQKNEMENIIEMIQEQLQG